MTALTHVTARAKDRKTVWDDRYFWVGSGDGVFWLHHNAKNAGRQEDDI